MPIPGWPDGEEVGAADELATSAARGRELAALLDSDTPVPGVTSGTLRPEIGVIAVPSTTDGGNMAGGDFDVTAGWGHFGSGQAVMPGQGRVVERPYTSEEREAMGDAVSILGETTFDVYLTQRPRLLAQRAGQRVGLQARGLPDAQEVAVIPGAQGAGEVAEAGGGPALHGGGEKGFGDAGAGGRGVTVSLALSPVLDTGADRGRFEIRPYSHRLRMRIPQSLWCNRLYRPSGGGFTMTTPGLK